MICSSGLFALVRDQWMDINSAAEVILSETGLKES